MTDISFFESLENHGGGYVVYNSEDMFSGGNVGAEASIFNESQEQKDIGVISGLLKKYGPKALVWMVVALAGVTTTGWAISAHQNKLNQGALQQANADNAELRAQVEANQATLDSARGEMSNAQDKLSKANLLREILGWGTALGGTLAGGYAAVKGGNNALKKIFGPDKSDNAVPTDTTGQVDYKKF